VAQRAAGLSSFLAALGRAEILGLCGFLLVLLELIGMGLAPRAEAHLMLARIHDLYEIDARATNVAERTRLRATE
jgi:hypothetical protein